MEILTVENLENLLQERLLDAEILHKAERNIIKIILKLDDKNTLR